MLTFKKFLEEKYLNIGFHDGQGKEHLEKHRQEMHDHLRNSYKEIGGYSGHKPGSKEESDAIHHDLSHHAVKAVRRNGKITALAVYKRAQDGKNRKLIGVGTNGTKEGAHDFRHHITREDHGQKRAWAEVSGAVEHIYRKAGMPQHPASSAEKILGKKVKINKDDPNRYTRKIGDEDHEKTILGHVKK